MKVSNLYSTALLSILAIGFVAPQAVNAAESTGTVTVEQGSAAPSDPIIDPENPDETPIDPNTPGVEPGETGPLAITNTTKLNFGKISTKNETIVTNAAAIALVDDAGVPTGKTRGNLVAWSDLRGSNAGYQITAKMASQFTLNGSDKKLNGATITYSNAMMETETLNKENAPQLTAAAASFTLGDGEEAVPVVDAAINSGAGTYVLEFGQSETYDDTNAVIGVAPIELGTDASSVKLTVPKATAASMTIGEYEATVLWTIASVPGA